MAETTTTRRPRRRQLGARLQSDLHARLTQYSQRSGKSYPAILADAYLKCKDEIQPSPGPDNPFEYREPTRLGPDSRLVQFYLSITQIDHLKSLARASGLSIAEVIRLLLARHLDQVHPMVEVTPPPVKDRGTVEIRYVGQEIARFKELVDYLESDPAFNDDVLSPHLGHSPLLEELRRAIDAVKDQLETTRTWEKSTGFPLDLGPDAPDLWPDAPQELGYPGAPPLVRATRAAFVAPTWEPEETSTERVPGS